MHELALHALHVALMKGQGTQYLWIDSTTLPVCKTQRIQHHKSLVQIASRGRSSIGWFYGCKLHIAMNQFGEIAQVSIGHDLRTGGATYNGKETVLGVAMMAMGGNSRTVSKAVDAKLQDIQNSLPKGVVIETVYDRTTLVEKAIKTVQKNLVEGAILVIIILFLFLGNIRAALITACVMNRTGFVGDFFI